MNNPTVTKEGGGHFVRMGRYSAQVLRHGGRTIIQHRITSTPLAVATLLQRRSVQPDEYRQVLEEALRIAKAGAA